jgi:hypothetical protein
VLARMEHERWLTERAPDGWMLRRQRDPVRKTSPYIVSWAELSEHTRDLDRDLDRDTVRGIPKFLSKVGFAVVRSS